MCLRAAAAHRRGPAAGPAVNDRQRGTSPRPASLTASPSPAGCARSHSRQPHCRGPRLIISDEPLHKEEPTIARSSLFALNNQPSGRSSLHAHRLRPMVRVGFWGGWGFSNTPRGAAASTTIRGRTIAHSAGGEDCGPASRGRPHGPLGARSRTSQHLGLNERGPSPKAAADSNHRKPQQPTRRSSGSSTPPMRVEQA